MEDPEIRTDIMNEDGDTAIFKTLDYFCTAGYTSIKHTILGMAHLLDGHGDGLYQKNSAGHTLMEELEHRKYYDLASQLELEYSK